MSRDFDGNAVTGASASAIERYSVAIQQFACYSGDPLATLAGAVEDSPDFAMAYLANAHMNLAGTDKSAIGVAEKALKAISGLNLNEREQAHAEAVRALKAGRFAEGHDRLEQIVIQHPRDLLAVQIAHLWDFLRGDARRLRERIAMVLPHWSEADRDYHALLGMHAFGLEECGHYAEAEQCGRQAVSMNYRDSWAQHAVAHVLEMQGHIDEGILWMRSNEKGWAPDNFFAVHNWWHLALYHLDKGEIDTVLALYDGPIRRNRSTLALDMVDASALLWRLHLRGIDVSERWAPLAEDWSPFAEDGFYAFSDVHAIMAFVGAGREELVNRTIATMERQADDTSTNAGMTRDVGLPVARALRAFSHGDYAKTVAAIRPIRSIANRFGGSHAQRDLLDLTMIEAAIRAGDKATATAFTAERSHRKPTSPLGWLLARRAREIGVRAAA
jgi:tetratricopeptide (TPR) repeat protein